MLHRTIHKEHVNTVELVLSAVEFLTGWCLVHGLAPVDEVLAVAGSVIHIIHWKDQ